MPLKFTKKSLYAFLLAILLLVSYPIVLRSFALPGSTAISSVGTIRYTMDPVILSFEAFDIELAGELQILVNDHVVATLPEADEPAWNEIWIPTPFEFDITDYCTNESNMITFHNPLTMGESMTRNVRVTQDGEEIFFDPTEQTIQPSSDALYGPFSLSGAPPPPPPPPPPPLNITGWYGIGEDYQLSMDYAGENPNYLSDWENLILNDPQFSQWAFTVIRLDFKFPSMDPNPNWADDIDLDYIKFGEVVRLLAEYGYKSLAVDHSWANFGSSAWMDEWTNFVTWLNEPGNLDIRDNIVAYELRDETSSGWAYEKGPWWNGEYCPDRSTPNWAYHVTGAYAELTDRVRQIQPGALVTWADPAAYYQSYIPPEHRRDGVIYAWHCWSTNAENKDERPPMQNWIDNYCGPAGYPNSDVWLGEFGDWTGHTNEGYCDHEGQKAIHLKHVEWCMENGKGFSLFYWYWWDEQPYYCDWLETAGFPKNV